MFFGKFGDFRSAGGLALRGLQNLVEPSYFDEICKYVLGKFSKNKVCILSNSFFFIIIVTFLAILALLSMSSYKI